MPWTAPNECSRRASRPTSTRTRSYGACVDLDHPDLPDQAGSATEPFDEEQQEADDAARGTAYVPLSRDADVWVGCASARTRLADGLDLTSDDSDWRLRCGIESLFLPQDEAPGWWCEAAVRTCPGRTC